jgi:3-hydroxyisobutyrate dehydrogenase-like beta-hydroxyacid dehydrogenase
MTTVGFVGLGRMGHHMARHLVDAGNTVIGFDTAETARLLAAGAGVRTIATIDGLAECSVVMSSLPDTAHVESVYLGSPGLFGLLRPGTVCVDLSTISVAGTVGLAAAGAERGITWLDAPVSGTSIHAEAGTLAIMVGGSVEGLDRVRPLLEAFSASIHHLGLPGAGLEMKLITNRLLTAHLVALGEAIAAMEAAGFDTDTCIELLRAGAVPKLLDYKAPSMARRDYSPLFTVGLMSKDLRLAAERRPAGPVTAQAASIMWAAEAAGLGPSDIGSVMEIISERTTS